jgi:hypothetical protein
MVLIRLGEGYDVTEADIGGAVDRVQALFHMEGARWDQVSHLIQSLRVGPGNFQLLRRLVIVRVHVTVIQQVLHITRFPGHASQLNAVMPLR